MQSQGSGVPESRYTMSYSHGSLGSDGVDLYGHGPDPYVLQHQHHMHSAGMSPTGHHGLGLGSPGQHHGHGGKRSADVAGLNLKQDPMVGDVTMSSIGMGHSTMDDGGGGGAGGQSAPGQNGAQAKKTPPPNGKKTKGRVKIKMEFIDNKLRRYTTFSKRKTGIMKKAYELSTLTGTQVMLLVASETGHVYTFATRKLQPMITSEAGKALIQTCLNSPDPPSSTQDQRMSATGFEETELTYTLHDEDQKEADSEDDENDVPSSEAGSRSPSPEPAGSRSPSEASASVSAKGSSSSSRIAAAPVADPGARQQQQQQQQQPAAACSSSSHQVANGSSRSCNAVTSAAAAAVPAAATSASLAVNLSASQLATLAANLPALSGLSLPGLPGGTANLATLLASVSASTLMAGGAASSLNGQHQSNPEGQHQLRNSSSTASKNLPQLISLAHLGAALQQAGSAKESGAKHLMIDQQHGNGSALDLHAPTNDKKGATGSKSRSRKSKK